MALRVELPDIGENVWVDVSDAAKDAIVEHMTENPEMTFSEASEDLLGIDLSGAE